MLLFIVKLLSCSAFQQIVYLPIVSGGSLRKAFILFRMFLLFLLPSNNIARTTEAVSAAIVFQA